MLRFYTVSSFQIKIFQTRVFYKNPKKVEHPFFTYLKAGGYSYFAEKLRTKADHWQKQRTCIKNQDNFLTQNILGNFCKR